MQDYLRVIKVKTKDTRAGFEDQYIEKDILLIIEDKMLVNKENADAVSSLELPSNLANGAEKLFTYDSVFGNTPDLIVIHMSKDLMNKPEAFSYALSRQMAELTAIKDALIKHEEGLPEAQMKKVIKEAEEPIHFDLADQNFVEQMFEMAKDDPDSEISKQFMRAVTEDGACFPAGTRITTDKGLKRIEDIQVGDMVLSKHESGIGEQEFKPVIRTVVHHNKEVWNLKYCLVKKSVKANSLSDFDILNMSRKGKVSGINATPNHPFWVKGVGWTRLDALQQGQLLEMRDSNYLAYVIFANPSYQTTKKDVFANLYYDTFLDVGEYLDDENYTHSQDNPQYSFIKYEDKKDGVILNDGQTSKSPLITEDNEEIRVLKDTRLSTVYNFEVADNHTYYIYDEIWVHNDNCPTPTDADVKRRQDNGAPPIQNVRIFHSKELANEYFRQNPTTTEIAIVKVGTARISKTTNKIMPSAKFELGVNNALVARITDAKGVVKEINYEYIIFREHPDYYLKNEDGSFVLDANNNKVINEDVSNFVKYEGYGEYDFGHGVRKAVIDRKLSFMFEGLDKDAGTYTTKSFANGARHKYIQNLYNQMSEFMKGNLKDIDLVYSISTKARLDIFEKYIIDAIKDPSFELQNVESGRRTILDQNGKEKDIWAGYQLKGVDPLSAQKLDLLKKMIEGYNDPATGQYIPPRFHYKLSEDPSTGVLYQQVTQEGNTYDPITLADIQSLLPVAKNYWLKAGASAKVLDSLQFHIADLPPATAAITQGAQITLDATGAGWGWFIDPTPLDNSEFIQGASFGMDAPKDSAAYGKLDLLTVLIHEMGHTLGMEPKLADDVMTRILDTGERRLPSELDALWLKRNASNQVAQTGVQVLQAKAWTPPTTRATLTNNDFTNQGDNWLTTGDIRFDSRTQSATLSETANTQTSLRQAFSLTADNRILSFTIADKGIKIF